MSKLSSPGIIESLRGANYAFVDVETTGTSAAYGNIIEIGIIRVEDGVITDEYQTLIRPNRPLPTIITSITGITDQDLENAPSFETVADRIQELLTDTVFVAHNAPFDYSFVKTEFRRLGIVWNAKTVCTVKVSRYLYPSEERHNLDALIARHKLPMEHRHRAFDDAYAMIAFLEAAKRNHAVEAIQKAIAKALGTHTLPTELDPAVVKDLPNAPGVYLFYGSEDEVLYVGKSIDIRSRVLSHFSDSRRTGRERALCDAIAYVEHEVTSGELSALLRESQLIKELVPIYNKKLRKAKKLATIVSETDENGYLRAGIAYRDELDTKDFGRTEGVFRTVSQGKTSLKQAVKTHSLCPKLLGLESGNGPCFQHQLDRCAGACIGKERPEVYNLRFRAAFEKRRLRSWPFKSAVMLPEDPTAEEGTVYVIDQWRILKTLSYTADGYDEEEVDSDFDYDSYRILSAHLLRKDVCSKLVPYREISETYV